MNKTQRGLIFFIVFSFLAFAGFRFFKKNEATTPLVQNTKQKKEFRRIPTALIDSNIPPLVRAACEASYAEEAWSKLRNITSFKDLEFVKTFEARYFEDPAKQRLIKVVQKIKTELSHPQKTYEVEANFYKSNTKFQTLPVLLDSSSRLLTETDSFIEILQKNSLFSSDFNTTLKEVRLEEVFKDKDELVFRKLDNGELSFLEINLKEVSANYEKLICRGGVGCYCQ